MYSSGPGNNGEEGTDCSESEWDTEYHFTFDGKKIIFKSFLAAG